MIATTDLESAIRAALPDVAHLEILDTSNGCGENYAVLVVSAAFEGKTTLARHRYINDLLRPQIAQMHAFSQTWMSGAGEQKSLTPTQYAAFLAKQGA